ncbi:tag-131 [Pristionchus pacificus]|nr:tag-131 [Pristionchus pacificus]
MAGSVSGSGGGGTSNGQAAVGLSTERIAGVKRRSPPSSGLYTTGLIYAAIQVAFLSFLCSYYEVGPTDAGAWVMQRLQENDYTRAKLEYVQSLVGGFAAPSKKSKRSMAEGETFDPMVKEGDDGVVNVLTPEQLGLFDGSRSSRPVYLAIVGRVYDVDKGKKHYGKGGGYSFFAGRDATRAFVSGDFTPAGLRDDVDGLSHEDILGIRDWVAFYEKDYKLVGVVAGRYYDAAGAPTEEMTNFLSRVQVATEWREAKAAEAEVFPPCNSEWHKDSGGRVWCTKRSGGIEREWSGLPRLYLDPATNQKRCVCVKNFGEGLSVHAQASGSNRGDLDHPALELYPNCKETANSCKIESD